MFATMIFPLFDKLWKRDPEDEAIPYAEGVIRRNRNNPDVAKAMLIYLRLRCETGNYNEPRLFNEMLDRLGQEGILRGDLCGVVDKIIS